MEFFHSLVCWWGFLVFSYFVLRTYAVYFWRNFFSLGFRGKAGGDGKEEEQEEEDERSVSKGALAMAAMAAEKAPAMAVASPQQQQPGVASAAVTGDGANALTREQMLRERYLKGVKKRKCTMCGNTARARSFFLSFFLSFLGAPLRTLSQTLYSPSQISRNMSGAMQFRGFKQSI